MRHALRRPGFTLVELLVVVGIMVVVATILIPVSLRLTERSQVATGISDVQGMLAQAKARAIATGKAYGVRFLAMRQEDRRVQPGGPDLAWYDRVEFIESQGDFNEGFVWGVVFDPTIPVPPGKVVRVPTWLSGINPTYPIADLPSEFVAFQVPTLWQQNNPLVPVANWPTTWRLYGPFGNISTGSPTGMGYLGGPPPPGNPTYPPLPGGRKQISPFSFSAATTELQSFVETGDLVEIAGVGQPYQVVAVNSPGAPIAGMPSNLLLDRALPHDIPMPMNGQPNYRILRQPRPVPGQPTKKLPGDVVIDLTPLTGGAMATNRDETGQLWMRGVSRGLAVTYPSGSTPAAVAPRYVDLLFSPSGQLISTARTFNANEGFTITGEGTVYLWAHPAASPNAWASGSMGAAAGNSDNQALISISAMSGGIGAYPVNQDAGTANPWIDAQRGRADGLGGL